MSKSKIINLIIQIALPSFTIGGQIAIALKKPEFGLILSFLAQPFWLYSSWKAYREANQIGILINTILFSIITFFGIINYWVL